MDYQRERLWGDSIGLRTPGAGVLTLLFLALAVIAGWFLWTGDYQRKAAVTGVLVADRGTVQVRAPADGIVEDMLVALGSRVGKGQTLLSLRSATETLDGEGVTKRLLAENRRQAGLLRQQLEDRHQAMSLEAARLDADFRALRQKGDRLDGLLANERAVLDLMNRQLARQRTLQDKGHLARADIEHYRVELLQQENRVQQLTLQQAENERALHDNRQKQRLSVLDNRRGLADLERALSELKVEHVRLQARETLSVVAPVTGTVAVIFPQPGQSVARQQPLLAVIPDDSRLEAELHVPSRAIGFIAPDLAVNLRLDAFPYQKFGLARATVNSVSRTVQLPEESRETTPIREPYYRVSAGLERQSVRAFGKEYGLRPGMQFQADIELERRRLWEWLLEPLFVRGRG